MSYSPVFKIHDILAWILFWITSFNVQSGGSFYKHNHVWVLNPSLFLPKHLFLLTPKTQLSSQHFQPPIGSPTSACSIASDPLRWASQVIPGRVIMDASMWRFWSNTSIEQSQKLQKCWWLGSGREQPRAVRSGGGCKWCYFPDPWGNWSNLTCASFWQMGGLTTN